MGNKNPDTSNLQPYEPGQSGNPSGRPKGIRDRRTIYKKWLEAQEKITNPITGEEETLEQQDVIALGLIRQARKGNVNAAQELFDAVYGKTPDKLEHSGPKGKPIQFNRVSIKRNKSDG